MNLAERLRGIVKPSPAASGPVVFDASILQAGGAGRTLEETLGGEWRDGCFTVERRIDGDAPYGRTRVREIAERLREAADHASLLTDGAPARPPFVFFDLETTGLNGGAGTYAFLVGCGSFDERGGFVTKQYVMARHAAERAMLASIAADLANAGALVSFNGKSFDVPVMETRYLFHRLPWWGSDRPHVDVLHPSRRFWGESSCSLGDLEREVLGAWRAGDVSGFEIPARYFQFVRSGDPRPLVPIVEHNRLDLLSLAGLAGRLMQLVARGPDAAADAREALALGRVYARCGLEARARHAFTCAVGFCERTSHRMNGTIRVAALHALALCERRARRYEDAASHWRAMLATPGCAPHLARQATEALAIHHEHRVRDLHAARTFARRSLGEEATPSWRAAVDRRLARISRKLERAGLLLEADEL